MAVKNVGKQKNQTLESTFITNGIRIITLLVSPE